MDNYQSEPANQLEYQYLERRWHEEHDPVLNSHIYGEMKLNNKSEDTSYHPFEEYK